MAKGRLLLRQISMSAQVHNLPDDTCRLLFTWIIPQLDIEGRLWGDPHIVKSLVFPRRADITVEQVDRYLDAMMGQGLLYRYAVNGEPYLSSPTWDLHQKLRTDREAKSTLPPPDDKLVKEWLERHGKGQYMISKGKIKKPRANSLMCPGCGYLKDLCVCEEEKDERERDRNRQDE